jgi:hypothetical protein
MWLLCGLLSVPAFGQYPTPKKQTPSPFSGGAPPQGRIYSPKVTPYPFRESDGKFYTVTNSAEWKRLDFRDVKGGKEKRAMYGGQSVILLNCKISADNISEYFRAAGTRTVKQGFGGTAELPVYDYGKPYDPAKQASQTNSSSAKP